MKIFKLFLFLTFLSTTVFAQNDVVNSGAGMGWTAVHVTIILSIMSFCLTLATVLPKALEKNKNISPEEKPGEKNIYCKQQKESIMRIEERIKDEIKTKQEIKDTINEIKIVIARLEKDVSNTKSTVEDMVENNRKLAMRLESLLGQLIGFIEN
jgi:predicted RNase H-like nuclease (RuvC/YqgF family)